jgi:hypothetical protein
MDLKSIAETRAGSNPVHDDFCFSFQTPPPEGPLFIDVNKQILPTCCPRHIGYGVYGDSDLDDRQA